MMKQIFEDSQRIEQQKKEKMIQSIHEAEKRQELLAQEQQRQIEMKKKMSKDRAEYQLKIAQQQRLNEQNKIQLLLTTRSNKEEQLQKTHQQREFE